MTMPEKCPGCDNTIDNIGIQYDYDHPQHYDGVSEWKCSDCGRREGRWSGRVLIGNDCEKRFGVPG